MSDEVKCPHCGEEIEDLWEYEGLDRDGASIRTECPECGKPIKISIQIHYDYEVVKDDHVHDWKDARNEFVESGEVCLGCGEIRAGNATTDKAPAAGDGR